MCRSTCSSGWGFRDVSSDVSSAPFTRSARPKALRRTAVSVHLGSGWSQAPRPGSRFARSLTMRPSRATTLTSEDCGARCRQPRQVLTGSSVLPPALWGVARSGELVSVAAPRRMRTAHPPKASAREDRSSVGFHHGIRLNIDLRASQFCRKAGVLALFADGE